MRRAAATVVALAALLPALPARATVVVTRTIVAPTTFGSSEGVVLLPDVVNRPDDPSTWRKRAVSTRGARCGYVKQEVEHVVPPGTFQDAERGVFGSVVPLPSGFGTGSAFTLAPDPATPVADFDVVFFRTIGACIPDITVLHMPATCTPIVVPLEGPPPTPEPREQEERGTGCGNWGGPRSAFTLIGPDAGTLTWNADYAMVVMTAGANARFVLTLDP